MKIFLGLDDTCGYYTQLEHGLKALGVSCTLVDAFPNPRYTFEHDPGMIGKVVEWIGKKTSPLKRGSVSRLCWVGLKGLSLLVLFLWSLPRYDVYIFSGGTTFLNSRDLWLLKLFKKRVIVVYHGSDSRPAYLAPLMLDCEGNFDAGACISETRVTKKKLKKVERYADIIIDNPKASHLHDRKIINWHCIGVPFACPVLPESDEDNCSGDAQCVIVHAPTRPGPKGTALIEKAINSLREKGHNIKFVMLVGRPHSEVLEALSGCDFVVDELYSDVIMAGFATEAGAYGKPSIVGMYEFEKTKGWIPQPEMIPPILGCLPEEVEPAIEKLIVDKEYRASLGRQARQFIEEQWSSEAVAKRFLSLANNEIPDGWWFNPEEITHLHGWGMTEKKVKECLRIILKTHGTSALQLSNKPVLEQAFVDFANGNQIPD